VGVGDAGYTLEMPSPIKGRLTLATDMTERRNQCLGSDSDYRFPNCRQEAIYSEEHCMDVQGPLFKRMRHDRSTP
jgi:hypothetical protein